MYVSGAVMFQNLSTLCVHASHCLRTNVPLYNGLQNLLRALIVAGANFEPLAFAYLSFFKPTKAEDFRPKRLVKFL